MVGLRMKALKPLTQLAPRRFAHGNTQAYAFGRAPGTPNEGWENMIYGFYGASTLLLVVGLANKPSTDIREWARNEALAREKVIAKGGTVEWGTYYNKNDGGYTFVKGAVGSTPTLEE